MLLDIERADQIGEFLRTSRLFANFGIPHQEIPTVPT